MLYCVYFFSPFRFRPVLGWLLSWGLVASWEISGFPNPSKAADSQCTFLCCVLPFLWNVLFPFPRSSVSSCVVNSYSMFKAQLKYHCCCREASPTPSFLLQAELVSSLFCLYLYPMALATGVLWVVMCGKIFVPLGAFGVWGPCLCHLWTTSTLSNVEL